MRTILLCATGLVVLVALATASGVETVWDGSTGTWEQAGSWSNGLPASDCPARVPAGTVTVTQAGAIAADLDVRGESPDFPGLQIQGLGTLEVPGRVTVSRGNVFQQGGTATYGRLQIADTNSGTYTLGGGSLTVGTFVLGNPPRTGSFSTSTGSLTVTDSLIVRLGGAATLNGLQTSYDIGDVVLEGILAVANGGQPIPFASLEMGPNARLHASPSIASLARIEVAGTATLQGTIQVLDVTGAFDGTYEVLRAGTLQGTFSAEDLPSDEWTWFVQGNSLYIQKGEGTPVEPVSWGGLKARGR